MAEKTYDIKRLWVTDAKPEDLKAHAEDVRANVIPLGYKLHSVVPMGSSQKGLVSFLEIYVKE